MIEPIRRSITVPRRRDEAFRLFTSGMGTWWPLETHGRADEFDGAKTERFEFEEREGGRIYEVLTNGVEADWGVVTAWDPPDRVVIDWSPSPEDRPYTEVEVTFTQLAEHTTRVDLTHRDWERLGEQAGAIARQQYEPGWTYVFDERYGQAAAR
ncbi:MAG: SRPBCC domain-containing protein [Actinomycetota bacterium]|nr:SRPBCC domain-containing protein [Actinomycetota bacterium]MDH5223703.1 SRPBCC domain-containing protein [Actinomycetota bacterium]MDH5313273.1 SRPBCC domain-containing protein [Actinomycetota bacterium]